MYRRWLPALQELYGNGPHVYLSRHPSEEGYRNPSGSDETLANPTTIHLQDRKAAGLRSSRSYVNDNRRSLLPKTFHRNPPISFHEAG